MDWRKSSYSTASSDCVEIGWRKSSYSSANSNCVEVASGAEQVCARDSKRPEPTLTFGRPEWADFLVSLG